MNTDTKTQTTDGSVVPGSRKKSQLPYLLDGVIIVAMGILMMCGASWQFFGHPFTDAAKYQCYAGAFLHGLPSVKSYPLSQCSFIYHTDGQTLTNAKIAASLHKHGVPDVLVNFVATQNLTSHFHALPHEYPLLTLIPFLIVLISPLAWYQVAFGLLMVVLAAVMYMMLLRFKSRKAAIVGAVLLVVGCWGTVAGRFDLVPSLLTLGVLIVAQRKLWNWAFVLLALAFLIKFYPAPFLLPLLLAQQMDSREKWLAWRRWQPLASFIGVCLVVTIVSLLLNVEGTIAPLTYFQSRPIQVESFGASMIWLSTYLKFHSMTYVFTYGSLNVIHVYTRLVSSVETVLLIAGLACTYWLQWRKKIDLSLSTLLTLLIVMVTGKVFSPQYLIWVVPMLVYVGGEELSWILPWVAICVLTTVIYPYIYNFSPGGLMKVPLNPLFNPTVALRNFILLGFVLGTLVSSLRKPGVVVSEEAESKKTEPEVGKTESEKFEQGDASVLSVSPSE